MVTDNLRGTGGGIGIPRNVDLSRAETLGEKLIRILAAQTEATV